MSVEYSPVPDTEPETQSLPSWGLRTEREDDKKQILRLRHKVTVDWD